MLRETSYSGAVGAAAPAPQGRRAGPVKADYGVVAPALSADAAFRAVCLAGVQHLEANREGMLEGGDPEFLHQMRVALRRLRTAFTVFAAAVPGEAAPLLAEMQWLRRALGGARDWDVFLARTLRPALARHPRRRGLRAVQRACEALAAEDAEVARRAVESRRYRKLVRELRALCYGGPRPDAPAAAPVGRHAAALAALHQRTRERGRRILRRDARELHRLRSAARKLRYGILFLAPLYPAERVAPMAGAVESLQESLGELNDCAVARELIARMRGEAGERRARKALKRLARRVEAARAARYELLKPKWKAFRAAAEFWRETAAGTA